jgi:hypothetical protein
MVWDIDYIFLIVVISRMLTVLIRTSWKVTTFHNYMDSFQSWIIAATGGFRSLSQTQIPTVASQLNVPCSTKSIMTHSVAGHFDTQGRQYTLIQAPSLKEVMMLKLSQTSYEVVGWI